MSIFFDVIVLVTDKKKVHKNLCLIPGEERLIFFDVIVLASQKKSSYELVSNSGWLPKQSCLNLQILRHC